MTLEELRGLARITWAMHLPEGSIDQQDLNDFIDFIVDFGDSPQQGQLEEALSKASVALLGQMHSAWAHLIILADIEEQAKELNAIDEPDSSAEAVKAADPEVEVGLSSLLGMLLGSGDFGMSLRARYLLCMLQLASSRH